jgi:GMP synthase (glutamine-hydrolysing)
MTRKILIIKHNRSANEDRTATHLAARGLDLEWRYPFAGEALPDGTGHLAGLVVLGGAYPVPEADRYPFLREEMRFIGRCLKADRPVLGICLGAQLLAHELGAAVGPHPDGHHEFGYYELFPTAAGRAEIPDGLHVVQSHYHEFALPAGATLLAKSALYAHQAFRHGRTAYGLQFHAEVTPAIFRRWQADHAPRYAGKPGVQPKAEQDRAVARHDPAQHAWFTGFLDRLFGERSSDDIRPPRGLAAPADLRPPQAERG